MAIHRRVRQAGRKVVAHVRRAGRALQGRRKDRGNAGDPKARALDERLHALAAYIRANRYYESPWQLFCYGQFKGLSDEDAMLELAAWARRERIAVKVEVRIVRQAEVVYLILRSADQ
jgi:hypothetical protein